MKDFFSFYPEGFFGDFGKRDVQEGKLFGLMNTFETNTLVKYLKAIEKSKNSKHDATYLIQEFKLDQEFANFINHPENYLDVFKVVQAQIREYIFEHRGDEFVYDRLFDSFLPDAFAHVIVHNMCGSLSFRAAVLENPKLAK